MNSRFYYVSQKMMDLWATEIYQFFFFVDASITKRVTENTSLKQFFFVGEMNLVKLRIWRRKNKLGSYCKFVFLFRELCVFSDFWK